MALSEYSKRLLGAYAEQPFLMAPMAGVTDPAYRIMCRRRGANLAYSEMVSVAGLAYASNKTWRLVLPADEEQQICVQLFGSKPEQFASAVVAVEERVGDRLSLIDINMACPARKVVTKGEGSALMRTPDQYRWADAERRPENVNAPWPVVPNSHPYNSVSHAENPRGIGLVDLVYALEEGRKPRASGEMALHSLEVMECILKSAHEHVFCEPTTTFEQPKPLDWQ